MGRVGVPGESMKTILAHFYRQVIGRFLGRYFEDFLQLCGVPRAQYAWGVLGKATVGLNNDA